jgi:hypothetical protein
MTLKTYILLSVVIALACVILYLSGSTKRQLKAELRELIEVSPFSASGSDLMLAVFGWPSIQKLDLKSLTVTLDPQASSKSGSATAIIAGIANGVEYNAIVSFTYFKSYTGGHGFSGGNSLGFSNFRRVNELAAFISSPEKFKTVHPGDSLQDSITSKSYRLPDGTLANYYQLDIDFNFSEVEIELIEKNKLELTLHLMVFKDNRMLITYSPENTGKFILLITGGNKTGDYTMYIKNNYNGNNE